ncbi:MAG: Asp-tRNA(Asn)/Glu-tRNA(Gln) amidotransferase subunit GatC, partial [Desulfobacterales bacterium]|nr:Asp-tRNA(Asn)/Glu-tRNA(Gln) amidotransferase subunit GatC [Desulfobacterales bacterium]
MKISREEMLHVAGLARIELDEASLDRFSEQIGKVLSYIDTLNRVDTRETAATFHATHLSAPLREDRVREHLDRDLALANAPEKD